MRFARLLEAKGITTISQAVKALERRDDETIAAWKAQLKALETPVAPAPEAAPEIVEAPATPAPEVEPAPEIVETPTAPEVTQEIVETPTAPEVAQEMKIINLTPHVINIRRADGSVIDIPPSGQVARCAETRVPAGEIAGIGVTIAVYGAVEGLPEPERNTIYIVSAIVLTRVPERKDVFAPGTLIRDADGKPIAADGLSGTPARLS